MSLGGRVGAGVSEERGTQLFFLGPGPVLTIAEPVSDAGKWREIRRGQGILGSCDGWRAEAGPEMCGH